jgi:hypothetical protein
VTFKVWNAAITDLMLNDATLDRETLVDRAVQVVSPRVAELLGRKLPWSEEDLATLRDGLRGISY